MRAIILVTVFSILVLLVGCGDPAPANNANNASANNTTANSNNILQTTTRTPEATTNDAPTLTPVFKAYCDAMNQKNEAVLRRIYSSDTIRHFEEQMKDENIKSLLKFLEDDQVGKLCEVRNELITGDSAVAEIRADSYPNGIKVVFVKENGEWKLTNRSPVLDSVKSSNSNMAK